MWDLVGPKGRRREKLEKGEKERLFVRRSRQEKTRDANGRNGEKIFINKTLKRNLSFSLQYRRRGKKPEHLRLPTKIDTGIAQSGKSLSLVIDVLYITRSNLLPHKGPKDLQTLKSLRIHLPHVR